MLVRLIDKKASPLDKDILDAKYDDRIVTIEPLPNGFLLTIKQTPVGSNKLLTNLLYWFIPMHQVLFATGDDKEMEPFIYHTGLTLDTSGLDDE
jgi:hypothetical protein